MARRRSNRKGGAGSPLKKLILLIVVAVAAMFSYQPLTNALQRGDWRGALTQVKEQLDAANRQPDSHTDLSATGGLELPAPLKGVPEKILKRTAYTVSYNSERKVPNWVAWELNRDRLVERESRTDKFLPDPDLPESEAVTTDDYKRTGWDRGHMCPAADCRWHWRAMQESFYMTNICPQHHNLNSGDWKELEDACRRWAEQEGRIYIVCGPIFYKGKPRTIGREHRVAVPDAFFKVVLCADSKQPRAIGFIYKNTAGNRKLDSYVNTVDQVERITGIDFFPALPDDVERRVEAKADLGEWQ